MISFIASTDTFPFFHKPVNNTEQIREIAQHEYKRMRIAENCQPKGSSTRAFWKQDMSPEQCRVNPNLLQSFGTLTQEQETNFPLNEPLIHSLLSLVMLEEEPKDKSPGTRARFGEVIQHWEGVDINSRNTPTIGSHKPDVLHRKLGRECEQSIRIVGEVIQMEGSGDFADEEQGQILDFLQTALTVQPWRSYIFGYLTDCKRFEFYCAKRGIKHDGEPFVYFEQSGVYVGYNGWNAMRLMVAQDDITLGFSDVHVEGWKLDTLLGTGATSVVFRAIGQSETAVCKLFLDVQHGSQLRENERTTLEKLAAFPCIPNVVPGAPARSACGRAVLIQRPVGLDIPREIRLPVSAYSPIVFALKYAHANDIFHNDIAPQNLLGITLPDNSKIALLNDFGSACGQDTIVNRLSSIASRPLFYREDYGFGAKADLCAFVRSIFYLTQLTFIPTDLESAEQLDDIICQQIWFWKEALRIAISEDYEGLYNHLVNGGTSSIQYHK